MGIVDGLNKDKADQIRAGLRAVLEQEDESKQSEDSVITEESIYLEPETGIEPQQKLVYPEGQVALEVNPEQTLNDEIKPSDVVQQIVMDVRAALKGLLRLLIKGDKDKDRDSKQGPEQEDKFVETEEAQTQQENNKIMGTLFGPKFLLPPLKGMFLIPQAQTGVKVEGSKGNSNSADNSKDWTSGLTGRKPENEDKPVSCRIEIIDGLLKDLWKRNAKHGPPKTGVDNSVSPTVPGSEDSGNSVSEVAEPSQIIDPVNQKSGKSNNSEQSYLPQVKENSVLRNTGPPAKDYNCAVASLLQLFVEVSASISLSQLLSDLLPVELVKALAPYTDEDGQTSMLGIQQVAAEYGLNLSAVRLVYKELQQLESPIIVHLDQKNGLGHYVVVFEVTDDTVSYIDKGVEKTVSKEEFLGQWTGFALVTEREKTTEALTPSETQEIKGAAAQEEPALDGKDYAPGEFIVKFKPGMSTNTIAEVNSEYNCSVLSINQVVGFMRLKVPEGKTVEEMVQIYSSMPNVEYAEPNYIVRASWVPNDPLYSSQWNLDNPVYGGINMERAWDINRGGNSNVIIAVIDTGVAYENYSVYYQAPELVGTRFVPGWDFVNNDSHPNDDAGHGTHVTGTIAQATNNGIGVAGIAFGCSIMPLKVLDALGSGYDSDIADAIIYAADHGADVINLSLGGPFPSLTLKNALAYAYGKGVTIVAAAGNDGATGNLPNYPAAYDDYVIAVGATGYNETVTSFSNRGSYVDLAAPGDKILQQTFDAPNYNDWDYWYYSGTSMATPHVSGVAALLIASGKATTPDEVRNILQSTAEDHGPIGRDDAYGWGILDAYAALSYNGTPNSPPVANVGGPYSGTVGSAVQFDGSLSSDPDGDTLTYRWDFGDGFTGTGVRPTHTYTAAGTYPVTLVVNDGKLDSTPSSTTATITVAPVNRKPVANVGGPYSGTVGNPVTFDGSGSTDLDGDLLTYRWTFGDGFTGTGVRPTHIYTAAGTYPVTLVVNDGKLDSTPSSTTATITVAP
ncbi:S8 family serine peptidase, partial [Candidatus Woesearchaeota archaeon]|nr:S8 family serine peptidase [Candidatus Woesearchaeota archaeon]